MYRDSELFSKDRFRTVTGVISARNCRGAVESVLLQTLRRSGYWPAKSGEEQTQISPYILYYFACPSFVRIVLEPSFRQASPRSALVRRLQRQRQRRLEKCELVRRRALKHMRAVPAGYDWPAPVGCMHGADTCGRQTEMRTQRSSGGAPGMRQKTSRSFSSASTSRAKAASLQTAMMGHGPRLMFRG